MGHVSWSMMSGGDKPLKICLLKVTTETYRTFSFMVFLAFVIYARFQKLKSFWLSFLWFLARGCPAFCLGQEESCWQLFGLCDLFGGVCEEHMPMFTSLLRPQEADSPKKCSKALPFALILICYRGGGSEQQGSPCPLAVGPLALCHLAPVWQWKNCPSVCISWSLSQPQ